MTEIETKIQEQIKMIIWKLSDNLDLIATINSYKDELDDESVLAMLENYNKTGTTWDNIICQRPDETNTNLN